jgi:hypothetical protein
MDLSYSFLLLPVAVFHKQFMIKLYGLEDYFCPRLNKNTQMNLNNE